MVIEYFENAKGEFVIFKLHKKNKNTPAINNLKDIFLQRRS
jgi:tRNA(Glu) U13 pseudouridine synthase TruD